MAEVSSFPVGRRHRQFEFQNRSLPFAVSPTNVSSGPAEMSLSES